MSKDDELTIDLTKFNNFIKKMNLGHITIILLLILPMFLSAYFRMYSSNLPITDEWARQSIKNQIQSQIAQGVAQQYPNLPQENRDQILNQQYTEWVKNNQEYLDSQIVQVSDQLKANFKDDNGNTYLLAIDPWFYYRHINNKIVKGSFGDIVKDDGSEWDMYMVAPLGGKIDPSFHEYFSFYFHKVISFFNPNTTLLATFFLVPVIIAMLSVIPAFFIARKVSGNFGGLIASIMVGIHSMYINRTAGGFSDTDAYNILFPLLIIWMVLEALDSKDLKKTIIFSSLGGLLIGLYSFSWTGWFYIFYVALISIITYVGYVILSQREKVFADIKSKKHNYISNTITVFIIFTLISTIALSAFSGFDEIKALSKRTKKVINLKQASKGTSIWPNVYTTVAELGSTNLAGIVSNLAPYKSESGKSLDKFYFFIVLMGMIISIIDLKKIKLMEYILFGFTAIWFLYVLSRQDLSLMLFLVLISLPIIGAIALSIIRRYKVDIKYAIFLIVWFCATIYGATKGVRFILLIVPVYGIAFGIALGKFAEVIIKLLNKEMSINISLSQIAVFSILALLLINPIKAADSTARREVPSMNDGWYQSLNKINMESAPDAIINSWWDFGHWFKAVGNRSVTFDGASQNNPQAHWIGKTLMTPDENQAMSILRMLDCGANSAFKKIELKLESSYKAVDYVYELISLDEKKARNFLKENFNENEINEIIKFVKCDPPEDYFIISEDMVGKSGVWAHFGSWNFNKATVYNYYKSYSQVEFIEKLNEEFKYSNEEAEKIFFEIQGLRTDRAVNDWIAPWPSYGGGAGCSQKNEMLLCNIKVNNNQRMPININLTSMDAYVIAQDRTVYPNSLGYYDENNEYIIKEYKGDLLGSSISLVQEGEEYTLILSAPELVGSMFTRLFYHNGRGLDHFEKFSDIRDITGSRIIVWKINWDLIKDE
ncbi:hypothetical protein HOD20_07820 [archaeon]|jgi:dolichyl-phosphooligosaccharide-protein glycotransferase|nr:hypothetical protein [archaeon]MBT4352416.1 hypothetical protein [archaeon]MBT4648442.1 hypothetical protein [archaeon]MBT6821750.1 hypothetical protein [archaeon]MBT7391220.1 hypothetical protein [archaeon]